MTTRSPRPGEADGKDYYFVSTEKFEETIKAGGLLEYAKYCDHYYGTPKQAVLSRMAEGKDVLLEIDVQGGRQIKKIFPETVLVLLSRRMQRLCLRDSADAVRRVRTSYIHGSRGRRMSPGSFRITITCS